MKRIALQGLSSKELAASHQEVKLLQSLRHPYICSYYGGTTASWHTHCACRFKACRTPAAACLPAVFSREGPACPRRYSLCPAAPTQASRN